MDIVFSLFLKAISYLWKNIRLVFFLVLALIVEIFIVVNWYDDKIREAEWATDSLVLDCNVIEKTEGTLKLNVTVANNRDMSLPWTSLYLDCGEADLLLVPVLEEPYGNEEIINSINPVIPSEEALQITYEVQDYEYYKKYIETADNPILRTSTRKQGGIPVEL